MRSSLLASCLLLVACTPAYPGEVDGTFDVVGALDQNSCGETALPATNPLLFAIELRSDESGQAFWRRPSTPVVSGTHLNDTYRFRFTTGIPVYDGDEAAGVVGCALIQEEVVEITPSDASATAADASADDAGADDASADDAGADDAGADDAGAALGGFSGTDVIRLTVAPGFDCSPLLGSAGGPFLALPCSVNYSLSGSPREGF